MGFRRRPGEHDAHEEGEGTDIPSGGSARRVLLVSVLALACAPSALADDSLLGAVTAPAAAVAVGDVESVPPVAVEVPAAPVPAVTAAVVETVSPAAAVGDVAEPVAPVEKVLPTLPDAAPPVAAVAETVTA